MNSYDWLSNLTQIGLKDSNRRFISPCYLDFHGWPWKTKGHLKLCASFRHHEWIQIRVMLRERLKWVLTSVTTFDLWPCPFTGTLLSLVITPESFMMIRWCGHNRKELHYTTSLRKECNPDVINPLIHRRPWQSLQLVTHIHQHNCYELKWLHLIMIFDEICI